MMIHPLFVFGDILSPRTNKRQKDCEFSECLSCLILSPPRVYKERGDSRQAEEQRPCRIRKRLGSRSHHSHSLPQTIAKISSTDFRLFSGCGQSDAICPTGIMTTASYPGNGKRSLSLPASKLHTQQVPSPSSVAARQRCSVAMATSISACGFPSHGRTHPSSSVL